MSKLMYAVVFAAMGLYYLRIYIKGSMCHLTNRVDGKVVLITGANTGLGLETALELVSRGGIVHITCRDEDKCRLAKEKIISRLGGHGESIITHTLDLASIRSILSFAKSFKKSVQSLDVLINNAGIMMCPYLETEDGFEMQIGVNHLGHFLLTNQLIDLLKKGVSPRIVIVSSRGHLRGSINKTDINLRGDDYGRMTAYGQSKLANILHAKVLAKKLREDGVAVVSLHPGVVDTELARHIPAAFQFMAKFTKFMYKTPVEGAQTSICCAVDPDLLQHTGKYFSDCLPTESRNEEVYDEALADHLWDQSDRLINEKMANLAL